MVCLVWFHVAALLLLLHTSTQTDVESNQPEDIKAEISKSEGRMKELRKYIKDRDSEIQSLRDKIIKADPSRMKNIDEFIKCQNEYWISRTAIQVSSATQNLQKDYQAKYPHVNFDSLNWEAFIMGKAERTKNMRSESELTKCNELIPYNTFNVGRIDEQIYLKYVDVKDLDIEFIKYSYLFQILEAMSDYEYDE
uniref:Uncharacterized protein n=2 Tax=Schistosoma mansoni TaxID=6183 RepID=A0A3Q0KIP1_SCHMA